MNIQLRAATAAELPLLLPLMQGYYQDDGLVFTDTNVGALRQLLATPEWGRVWLIAVDAHTVGYAVLCFGYSVELGGREAYIDELYVERELRRRGIAKAALGLLLIEARDLGIRALHLEVDMTNERAVHLYASAGFVARDRYHFMTRTIGAA